MIFWGVEKKPFMAQPFFSRTFWVWIFLNFSRNRLYRVSLKRVPRTRKGRRRQRVRAARASFPSGLAYPGIFSSEEGHFFETPPARPGLQHPVVFASPEDVFFQEDENSIFNASFALKYADFISKTGVDAKSTLPSVTVFRFFGKISGILLYFQKFGRFF